MRRSFLAFVSFSAGDSVEDLITNAQKLVRGVGQAGCGLEAQLEIAYRFLVQPDPWASVQVDDASRAQFVGIDETVFAQRKAFLRPDSLVAVVRRPPRGPAASLRARCGWQRAGSREWSRVEHQRR
jgi:hypothetical protein